MTERTFDKRTLRNIIIFSLIVLSCGWIGRFVDLKIELKDASGSLGMLIWIASPLVAMVIIRSFMGDGWKDFGLKPKIKGNRFPYLVSLFIYPIIAFMIILIGHNFKLIGTANLSSTVLAAFGVAIIPSLIKNIFEESAWRGYLAPRLFSMGYNRLFVHLIVGFIWASWHIPYILVLVNTTESMITFIPRMIIGLMVASIVYGELWFITRSIWPAIIMHTMGNVLVDTLFVKEYLSARAGFEYLAMPSPEGIITIGMTAIVGFWLYRRNNKLKVKIVL